MENFKTKIALKAAKTLFEIKKASPEILIGLGIAAGIASVVMACKSTRKLDETIDSEEKAIEDIHEKEKASEPSEETKQALAIHYANAAVKIFKLYLPSIALGMLSIFCILYSNNLLRTRNAALASALVVTANEFTEYRQQVIDKYGAEIDSEIKHGVEKTKVEVFDEEKNKKVKKIEYTIPNERRYSNYSRVFDALNSKCWRKDRTLNLLFIDKVEKEMNNLLRIRGYVLLNEVYEALGMEPTSAGYQVGWVKGSSIGDDYISFNALEGIAETLDERVFFLDFNVDGPILDALPLRKI